MESCLIPVKEMAYDIGSEIETAGANGLSLLHDLAGEFPGYFCKAVYVLQRLANIMSRVNQDGVIDVLINILMFVGIHTSH